MFKKRKSYIKLLARARQQHNIHEISRLSGLIVAIDLIRLHRVMCK